MSQPQPEVYSFNEEEITNALNAARQSFEGVTVGQEITVASIGELSISGGCISVTVRNGRICLELPLGLGSHCIPIPIQFPDGTAAQACLNICTTWGFPTGACVSVSIAGLQIVRQCFGSC